MKKATNKLKILKILYETKLHLTASDFNISNANQYLIELESQKLITRYTVKDDGVTPYKLAYISQDTKENAKKYLNAFISNRDRKNESQES